MEDFDSIESLWQVLEFDMKVTQRNLLRALTAICGLYVEALIFDPLKEYLDESQIDRKPILKQKTFPQGCIANDTLYFNSENAIRLFSSTYKDKISYPLIGKSNVQASQEEYETRPKQLQNPD